VFSFLLIYICGVWSFLVVTYTLYVIGSRANYNVRVKLHRNLLLQEAAFFDSNEVGYLLSRLNNDVSD
jgi:ABC-type multidrug transport system fused ATPase/permease subunit